MIYVFVILRPYIFSVPNLGVYLKQMYVVPSVNGIEGHDCAIP